MAKPKNIILITVDSLRRDFVGCYDERGKGLTPNMGEFAEKSVVFESAIAQGSYTRSSVPSFFTSTYPWKLKPGGDISGRPTLATVLKDNDYNTAFYHSNPFLSKALGYNRGFDVFDDSLLPWNINLSQKRTRQLGRLFRIARKAPYLPAESLVKKSVSWLERATEPYFLWLHLMDPHGPYQRQDGGYLEKFRAERLWQKAVNSPADISDEERDKLIESYRSEVNYADKQVGRLLEYLSEAEEDNVVVITADHGEEFGEHGDFSHNPKPFDELIRVPFLLNVPDGEGERVKDQLALLDLLPSLLDLARVDWEDNEFDGATFAPLFSEGGWEGREHVICQPGPDLICLRTEGWKFVVKNEERMLYDLENDPGEKKDVSGAREDLVEKFERILAEKESEYGSSEDFPEGSLGQDEDEETRKRLEDLGYL